MDANAGPLSLDDNAVDSGLTSALDAALNKMIKSEPMTRMDDKEQVSIDMSSPIAGKHINIQPERSPSAPARRNSGTRASQTLASGQGSATESRPAIPVGSVMFRSPLLEHVNHWTYVENRGEGILHSVQRDDVGNETYSVELNSGKVISCKVHDFIYIVDHSTTNSPPRELIISISNLNNQLLKPGKGDIYSGHSMIASAMDVHSKWLMTVPVKTMFEVLVPKYLLSEFVVSVQLILLLLATAVFFSSVLLWNFNDHHSIFHCHFSPLHAGREVMAVVPQTAHVHDTCPGVSRPSIQLAFFHGFCGVAFVCAGASYLHACHKAKEFLRPTRFKVFTIISMPATLGLITFVDEVAPRFSYIVIIMVVLPVIWLLNYGLGPRLRRAIHFVHQPLPTASPPDTSHCEQAVHVGIVPRSEAESPCPDDASNNSDLVVNWSARPSYECLLRWGLGVTTIFYIGIMLPFYRSTTPGLKLFLRGFIHPVLTICGVGVLRSVALSQSKNVALGERGLCSILFIGVMEMVGTFCVLSVNDIGLLIGLVLCAAVEQLLRRWFGMWLQGWFHKLCRCSSSDLGDSDMIDLTCQMAVENRSGVAFSLCYSVLVPIAVYLFFAHRLVFDLGYQPLTPPDGTHMAVAAILLYDFFIIKRFILNFTMSIALFEVCAAADQCECLSCQRSPAGNTPRLSLRYYLIV